MSATRALRRVHRRAGVGGVAVVLLIVAVSVFVGPGGRPSVGALPPADAALVDAIGARRSGVMVSLEARVVRLLPDDNDGSRHQRLLLLLDEPIAVVETILIAHNIDLAPRVPCEEGDRLLVRGQYEWNEKGGVIHWTHHDPRDRREGGWIEHNGLRYE